MDFLLKFFIFAQTNIPGGATPAPDQPATPAPSQVATTAQTATPTVPQPEVQPRGGGMWETLIFLGVIFLIFWLLIIRPQQKKTKQHNEFIKNIKRGDSVITASGMIGKIINIEESVVTLEVAKEVKIKFLKSQISGNFMEKEQEGTK